jgi:hypothetical protein
MKIISYILILIILGSVFVPNNSHICGAKTVKSCCAKENLATSEKKCCKKTIAQKETSKSCNGKCNHENCNTTNIQSFVLIPDIFVLKHDFSFETILKNKFFDKKSKISSGFNFIWIPPTIG